jgi:ATP-dependent HslUV protease ATP-binding subunit HslU
MRKKLQAGELDDREIEIDVRASAEPIANVFTSVGGEELGAEFQQAMDRMLPKRTKTRRAKVRDARNLLQQEEADKLIDEDAVLQEALERAENQGIVFIDELDKIAGGARDTRGPDVSREGVQRDLLPVVEGTTVTTRHGAVKTDHILFIAAGAFHMSKPSDLIPELQGRFPIRVELQSLDRDDFVRILTSPRNALTKQYEALLGTEGLTLEFLPEALERLAELAAEANRTAQDIGARRLHTVMERLLEEVSFDAPDLRKKRIRVDAAMVDERLSNILKDEDLTRYVL